MSKRWIKFGVRLLIVAPLVVIASWAITDIMVHETGHAEFCGTCHTMAPMIAAYRDDVHGGASDHGVVADCAQCHAPHNNPVNYLWAKTRFGAHDLWATLTYDLDAIDWEAKRRHSERFVFDSGCLSCHKALESASESDHRTFVAHRPYFQGTTSKQCVTCHSRVGHRNLSAHLSESGQGEQQP